MEIKRDLYLNKLIQRKHNGLIKVITGIRRCGKSYLLNTIFKNHLLSEGIDSDHIIEMAFDDYENAKFRDPDVFYSFAKEKIKDNNMYYFLLDEVQLLNNFESVLLGLMHRKNADVYVTGSNAKFLSKDIITEFRGRGDEIHMYPLSFSEFLTVYEGEKSDALNEYMVYGGLPLVVLTPDPEHKTELLNSLFSETYLSDILTRNRLKNTGEMGELISILSSNIGSLTNPSKLQNTFRTVKKSKITAATITKYLGYLSEAYLIEGTKRYDIRGKAYIETPLKYYFTDLGLRNASISFRQIEPTHSMENIIYNELCSRGFSVDIGTVNISERNNLGIPTRKQLEVDFVANKGSKRYYIQSAYAIPDGDKLEQETRPLNKIEDSFKKIIISHNAPAPFYSEDGILTMNILDFLINKNSLDF